MADTPILGGPPMPVVPCGDGEPVWLEGACRPLAPRPGATALATVAWYVAKAGDHHKAAGLLSEGERALDSVRSAKDRRMFHLMSERVRCVLGDRQAHEQALTHAAPLTGLSLGEREVVLETARELADPVQLRRWCARLLAGDDLHHLEPVLGDLGTDAVEALARELAGTSW